MRRILASLPIVAALLLAAAPVLAAHTVTVETGDMEGWEFRTSDGGTPPNTATATFVVGPGTPPLGTGSVQLAVGANGASGAEIRTSAYSGTALADLEALSYASFISAPGSGGQAPYIILSVDLDGDSTSDDLLFFEPLYQDGTYPGDPVPDQGAVTPGVWQDWDAAAGGWWSLAAGTFGPPLVTLDTYAAANPGATLLTLRIVTGFGAGAWDNFVGNVDAVVIGTATHETTFDFEVASVAAPTPTPTPTPVPTMAATPEPTPSPTPEAQLLPDTAAGAQRLESVPVIAVLGALAAIGVYGVRRRREGA